MESVAFVAELVAAVEERGGAAAELGERGLGGGEFVGRVGEVASCCSATEGSAVGDGSFGLPLAFLGLGDVVVGGGDRGVVGRAARLELVEVVGEIPDAACDASVLAAQLVQRVVCVCELGGGLLVGVVEPVRDRTPWSQCRCRRDGGGELAALGDGGEVGAVGGEDGFEDVACLVEVVGVGDDADGVVLLAAGDADVQAAPCGGGGDELGAGGDGVGLVAVLGRRVAEPDVLAGVVGGEGDGAVSRQVGHGEFAVGVGVGDGPQFAVADRLPGVGDEVSVVAAGGDDIAGMGVFAAADRDAQVGVEVAGVEAGGLDRCVDGVDVFVGAGGDRDRVAGWCGG